MIHLAYIDPGTIYTVGSGLAAVAAAALSALALVAVFFRRLWGFAKRHRVAVVAALAVVIVAVLGVVWTMGTRGRTQMTDSLKNNRFIVIALDGLSPEILEPMMAAGDAPNFARLRAAGSYARIGTTNPSESPVAWATFATGRNPGKHGVYDFIRREPNSYLPDLSLTRLHGDRSLPVRRGKAFWNYGGETGVPMTILACPVTFPPDDINGVMLSGMGTPDLLGTQGLFAFYTTAPETVTQDTGGEVHVVPPANPLRLELYGPRKRTLTGKIERLTSPFEVRVDEINERVTIALGGHEVTLAVGEWSDWQTVQFQVGPLRRMHGILRFNLVAVKPHLKLYASPINIDPRSPWFAISSPPTYGKRIADELGLFATRGMPFDTWALNEDRLSEDAFIADAQALLAERERLLRHELARTERGVFFCYFEYPDIIQHMYWRFIDQRHPLYDAGAPPELKNMIEDCYRKMDAVVGTVLAALRPGDTLVVLSDHGFTTWRRVAHVNSWLRQNGYLTLRDWGVESGAPLFQDVDWSATRAYALGFGGIYINRKGREPQGIVGDEQAEALKREIAAKIAAWTDPATGVPVVHRVYRQEEIFRGPEAHQAPDLYLGFERGYGASWQTALGAAPAVLVENNERKWSGTHLVDPSLVPGVLFANRRIMKLEPTLYDLAPTILKAMGFDAARLAREDLDGTPLF